MSDLCRQLSYLMMLVVAGCSVISNEEVTPSSRRVGQSRRPSTPVGSTYHGYLEIDPLVLGKGSQSATVHVSKGKRIVVEMRYTRDHLRYVNKRVVVVGHDTDSSIEHGHGPQSYRFFKVDKITLAPGETPHSKTPTNVPAPPVARSKADLDALPGQWAIAVGKASYHYQNRQIIERVVLTLSDGYRLTHHLNRGVPSGLYNIGETASLLLRYLPTARDPVKGYGFCRGEIRRCCMTKGKHR